MSRFDAVGFGALNVDRLLNVNRIAAAEEESFVVGTSETCGGSAANTMVGLARLDRKVGFIGKVASDTEGRMLLEDFQKEGVDTAGVSVDKKGRSGKVFGFVDDMGQRALYIDPGVNDTVEFDQADVNYALQSEFIHLTSFVGKKSFETQKKLVGRLSKHVEVSFDPGALYARLGLEALGHIIDKAAVMLPNAGELALITGKKDYRAGAKLLIEKGVKVLAVKLGSKGCYVTDGKKSHAVKPFRVKVVDTTGAGDAFNAGFLYGLLLQKELEECGRLGNFVASRCVIAMGARAGLPRIEDLEVAGFK